MRLFAGQYERTIDAKNRIQLPSPLRSVVDPDKEGCLLYVTLGTHRNTLAIYTAGGFEKVAARIRRYGSRDPGAKQFRLQFFSQTSPVEMDKQGRFVLPDHLRRKADLKGDVILTGQDDHIRIWTSPVFDDALGIDWSSDQWVDWDPYMSDEPDEGVIPPGTDGMGGTEGTNGTTGMNGPDPIEPA
ncbi:MAG: division/cell wall cluster transcriptional repressor MraZ [Phycisphaerae bacterium]